MSHLQIFENERFGRVRTIEQNGEPWFIARDVKSHGECLTLNIGASPSIAKESSLLRVLEIGGVDQKYYLSPKACQGILRRAKARKKQLPELLYRVLKHQSMTSETDK